MDNQTRNHSREIAIGDLTPGMVIVRILEQNGPVVIRKSGLVSSADMVRGLAEMGVLKVEIDPEQTVEIETPSVASTSQTQQLLTRDRVRSGMDKRVGNLDQGINEQFNRSLFLPSVQEIPGAWHYYLRQYAGIGLVIAGGLALGWTGATWQNWLPALMPAQPVASSSVTSPQSQQNVEVGATELAVQTPEVTAPKQQASTPDPVPSASTDSQSDLLAASVSGGTETPTEENDTAGVDVNTTTASVDSPADNISPELLKKFELAIAELDSSPEEEVATPQKTVNDMPMIHELPAWLLTRMPAMTFSAHMYATDVNERWVRVNDVRIVEGQEISNGLTLVKIEPQYVILRFEGHEFAMAALTDW